MTAPEQPTPEEIEAAREYLDDWFGLGQWPFVHKFPQLLVGFAAQRAAEAVERERARCAWLAGDGCRSREELIAGIKGGETPEGKMRARWAAMLAAAPTCNETLQVQTPATPPPGDVGERLRRCAICGFMVDTQFAAEKPTVHVGQGGKQ